MKQMQPDPNPKKLIAPYDRRMRRESTLYLKLVSDQNIGIRNS